MPNTREKMEVIAHLGDHITYREGIGICYDSALAKVIEDAYMTLKNGVTAQEWISVKDRLPEDLEENKGKKVINCIVEHDPYGNKKTKAQFRQRKYDKCSDKWYWSKIGGCTVIRWTMIPQPTKRE